MQQLPQHRPAVTLCELNSLIRSAINQALPDLYWVIAEIAESKCNQRGHCYLDLVEKEDNKTIAQIRATIWAYDYRTLSRKFELATKTTIRPGIKVLMLAAVSYHDVYGLSLNVKDVDPAYTMGEMAIRKKEIIDRLRKEGIIDLNKELPLPLVPQNIAVISSPTAAGYGDFIDQLDRNPDGYKFTHVLFPALMQGAETEKSIINAFDKIEKMSADFDIVVVIRGGGSVADLSSFDSYTLARSIALFPLPVITGIGHEKDDTVADIVAHTKMKTPTAVAEFIISGVRSFEERITKIDNTLRRFTERLLGDSSYYLDSLIRRIYLVPSHIIVAPMNHINSIEKTIVGSVRQYLRHKESKLAVMDQAMRLMDPDNVLKRGYSITRYNGKALRDVSVICKGDVIETRLCRGCITSIAENITINGGQEPESVV